MNRIEGKITDETLDGFKPASVIYLDSPGGLMEPSLRIAEMVREAGSTVVIPEDASCNSGCALIWIAAKHRKIEGEVGFHGVFNDKESTDLAPKATHDLVSIYKSWGLSSDFATWATQREMHYLTPSLAKQFGIAVENDVAEADTPQPDEKPQKQ